MFGFRLSPGLGSRLEGLRIEGNSIKDFKVVPSMFVTLGFGP